MEIMICQIITVAVSLTILFATGNAEERLKLSSLPQLKKWEIPAMPQKYAMRTGRKFKDIDRVFEKGRKRSSHWSIAPEINFREMDLEEDDEKIKLDHNYKVFVESDDELPKTADKKDQINLKHVKDKSPRESRSSDHAKKSTDHKTVHVNKVNKSLNTTGKGTNQKQNKVKALAVPQSHPSAKAETAKGTFLDSSEGQGKNSFSIADLKSNIQQQSHPIAFQKQSKNLVLKEHALIQSNNQLDNAKSGDLMTKRSAPPFNEAVRKARAAINALQQTKRQGTAKPRAHPDLMKLINLNGGKPIHSELIPASKHKQIQERNIQESKTQAMKLLKNSNLEKKNPENKGVLGDQPTSPQSKVHNNIQNKINSNNINNHVRNPSVSPVTKPRLNAPVEETSLSQRAKIETPQGGKSKDKMKIVPANVARAVAMAMEQLKRDKMWGKVFVHVLPSGKLKVMVQETKKMPDE